jgi:hypothetical protein
VKIVLVRTIEQLTPHDGNLEDAAIGLTWWQRTSQMLTELKTDQYYKARYLWLVSYLTIVQTFHSDISSGGNLLLSYLLFNLANQTLKKFKQQSKTVLLIVVTIFEHNKSNYLKQH